MYKYIYPKKKINLLFLLILISLLPLVSLLRKGTYVDGDLTLHTVYLMSFYENLKQGIIVPQWSSWLCGGYGCPVHMFEYVMPYYIGSFFKLFGFSFLNSMKLTIASAYILSGVGMYFFAKKEFGKIPGFTAALLYLFAPYHLIEMHFRVSVGMILAFTFVPYVFYFFRRLLSTNNFLFLVLGGISLAFLILSHPSIAIATTILILPYGFFILTITKGKIIIGLLEIVGFFLIGLALTASYVFPALAEVKYTWYAYLIFGAGNFRPLNEYIYSPSRFGLLFQGNNGELHVIIGYAQLLVVIIAVILLIKNRIKRNDKDRPFLFFFLSSFIFFFFLLQSISKPVWQYVPLLKTFAIVWRMLLPLNFITAVIGAIIIKKIKSKYFFIFLCSFTIFSTILNWGTRTIIPEDKKAYLTTWVMYSEYFDPTNPKYIKRLKERESLQQKLVLKRPKYPIEIVNGEANIVQINRTPVSHEYLINAKTELFIKENTYYFPGWVLKVDNFTQPIDYENPTHFGIITFKLPKGLHKIDALFIDTPIRAISKYISSISLLMVILFISKKIYGLRKIDRTDY